MNETRVVLPKTLYKLGVKLFGKIYMDKNYLVSRYVKLTKEKIGGEE